MTSGSDVLALVLELLTWVGIVPGVILLIIGYTRRALASRFEETWGIVIPSPAGSGHPWFRWMDLSREFQSAPVDRDDLEIGAEVKVYFDPRNPENGRLDDPAGDGHALRVVGWLLVAIGAAAGVGQLIALFLE